MNFESRIIRWIRQDRGRMAALETASGLGLDDWCIAAGFVRNLVWDKLHGKDRTTPLNDIDLIYFDRNCRDAAVDKAIESQLKSDLDLPWSVKNQARMHVRNLDAPYDSTSHAMTFWVEVETAVGVRLDDSGDMVLVAPFGVEHLFAYTVTLNPKRRKMSEFQRRVGEKRWLEHWPRLAVID